MRIIRNYKLFTESLFKKEKTIMKKTKIDTCVDKILSFLEENQIHDWDDFEAMSTFDRQIIDRLIDSEVDNMKDLKEVKFGLKLKLCNKNQLKSLLKQCESDEEYEKCSLIMKIIKKI